MELKFYIEINKIKLASNHMKHVNCVKSFLFILKYEYKLFKYFILLCHNMNTVYLLIKYNIMSFIS